MKIRLKDVSKEYEAPEGSLLALDRVSVDIAEGEFFCLLGPSGCGKTTLLNLMAGYERPTRGQVLIDGRIVTSPDPRRLTIFQEYGLLPWRTVLGNVEFGLELAGVGRSQRRVRAVEYIDLVGLAGFEDRYPHQLSGGMKQRVAVARALALDPEVLFMDEPFGALDAITRLRMEDEIIGIWLQRRRTVVFVTHDIDEAIYLGDRVAVMTPNPGRIRSILEVSLGRRRVRTDPDFLRLRKQVYKEFELVTEKPFAYQI